MRKTLIVPLDGSATAEAVLPWAVELARARGLTLILAQVLRWPPAPVFADPYVGRAAGLFDDLLDDERATAGEYLESVQRRLSGRDVRIRTAIAEGEAAEGIFELAERHGAYAIAMGTHGHGGLRRLVPGSVTEQVLHRSTVPVLLVRAQPDPAVRPPAFRRLVVPLDGSTFGECALGLAHEVAAPGATLSLVRVLEPARSGHRGGDGAGPEHDVVAADEYLARLAGALRREGLSAETRRRIGQDWREILDVAHRDEADLIVMAAHHHAGPTGWLHGSDTDRVTRHADVPVLVASARALTDRAVGALLVGDAMTRRAGALRPDQPLGAAMRALARVRLAGIPVVDEAGLLVGVLTDADLIEWQARLVDRLPKERPDAVGYADHVLHDPVGQAMTSPAPSIEVGARLEAALERLRTERAGVLVATRDGRPVGILTRADVVRAMAGRAPLAPDPSAAAQASPAHASA